MQMRMDDPLWVNTCSLSSSFRPSQCMRTAAGNQGAAEPSEQHEDTNVTEASLPCTAQ